MAEPWNDAVSTKGGLIARRGVYTSHKTFMLSLKYARNVAQYLELPMDTDETKIEVACSVELGMRMSNALSYG